MSKAKKIVIGAVVGLLATYAASLALLAALGVKVELPTSADPSAEARDRALRGYRERLRRIKGELAEVRARAEAKAIPDSAGSRTPNP